MFAIFLALFLTVLTLVVGVPVQQERTLDFKTSFESSERLHEALSSTAPVFADNVPLEPLPISREQYEAALDVPAARYTGDAPHTTYQSLAVHWEEYDEFFSHIVLGLSLPEIPGYDRLKEEGSFDRRAYLTVSRVLDTAGKNVYDADHSFEEAPFNGIGLRLMNELPGYIQGERQIHVLKGVKATDVARIEGQVQLALPVNVRPLEFTRTEIEQKKTLAGTSVTLTVVEGQEYAFRYAGDKARIIKWVGYDAEGRAHLPLTISSDIQDEVEQPISLSAHFDQPIETLKVFIAEDILTKTLPFTLVTKK